MKIIVWFILYIFISLLYHFLCFILLPQELQFLISPVYVCCFFIHPEIGVVSGVCLLLCILNCYIWISRSDCTVVALIEKTWLISRLKILNKIHYFFTFNKNIWSSPVSVNPSDCVFWRSTGLICIYFIPFVAWWMRSALGCYIKALDKRCVGGYRTERRGGGDVSCAWLPPLADSSPLGAGTSSPHSPLCILWLATVMSWFSLLSSAEHRWTSSESLCCPCHTESCVHTKLMED